MEQENTNNVDSAVWLKRIKAAEEELAPWRKQAKAYYELYEGGKPDQDSGNALDHYNILFSNTETLRANVYNRAPDPRVSPRFKMGDPIVATAADVLEKALSFEIDNGDADGVMKPIITDALVPGIGHARVRYEPKMVQREIKDALGGPVLNEEGQPVTEEVIGFQSVSMEQVDYDKFVWDCTRRWDKCQWIAFEHDFTKEEIEETFELEAGTYTLSDYGNKKSSGQEQKCKVYEVWHKKKRQVFFLVAGVEQVQKLTDDPLRLEHFFPCPAPIQFLKRNTSTKPLPEYSLYRKPAEKLARIEERKDKIIRYVKAVGVYDKSSTEIADLLTAEDGQMIPAEMNLMAEGGQPMVAKSFEMLPIDGFAKVLSQLEREGADAKQVIYDVTGISDIMRGQSVASESATAQRIKGNFGTLRVQERQKEVARFVRDIIRLLGELIAEHYTPEVLSMITGLQVTPEMVAILRDDAVRAYNVTIEDDSTIAPDEEAEKKNVTEMLTGITSFLTSVGPIVQSGAMPLDAAKELLLMAVRTFRGSRAAEEAIQKIQQPVPPAPPVPTPGAGGVVVPPQGQPNGMPM
ncbi:hypothetical protein CFBP5875_04635 [Agrobacterium pusense]|uniref:hypothetical protein n=1 Tax=Agrobacterium pusense TaxID=648995 RepID=UPI0010BF5971|nr:hypothetical protein [Agrobacterium pusense]QCL83905.1 hypothetical protein CFBP5875_04635 [Agrobacterium pusense]